MVYVKFRNILFPQGLFLSLSAVSPDLSGPVFSSQHKKLAATQVADRRIPFEQVEQNAQGFAALALEIGIVTHYQPGIVARNGQQIAVRGEVGKTECWQAALPGAEYFSAPRSFRSSSAIRKPSSVSRITANLARPVSEMGEPNSSRQVEAALPLPTRPRN